MADTPVCITVDMREARSGTPEPLRAAGVREGKAVVVFVIARAVSGETTLLEFEESACPEPECAHRPLAAARAVEAGYEPLAVFDETEPAGAVIVAERRRTAVAERRFVEAYGAARKAHVVLESLANTDEAANEPSESAESLPRAVQAVDRVMTHHAEAYAALNRRGGAQRDHE